MNILQRGLSHTEDSAGSSQNKIIIVEIWWTVARTSLPPILLPDTYMDNIHRSIIPPRTQHRSMSHLDSAKVFRNKNTIIIRTVEIKIL